MSQHWLRTAVRWGRGHKKAPDSQGGRWESWALKQVNHGACGVVFITGRWIHQGYVKCYSRLSAALLKLEDWKVVLETLSISFLLCFWNTMRKETETRKGCARGPVFCQSSHLLNLTWWVQNLLCPRLPALCRWVFVPGDSWWLGGCVVPPTAGPSRGTRIRRAPRCRRQSHGGARRGSCLLGACVNRPRWMDSLLRRSWLTC